MKTTVQKLKKLIAEVVSGQQNEAQSFGLSPNGGKRPAKYDTTRHTIDDVMYAVKREFDGVAHDLGVDDIRDPAFIDYIGEALYDSGVPRDVILLVKAKLERGGHI